MSASEDPKNPTGLGDLPDLLELTVGGWKDEFCRPDGIQFTEIVVAAEDRGTLLRLVASSDFAGKTLLKERAWFLRAIAERTFDAPANTTAFSDTCNAIGSDNDTVDKAKSRLRRLRNRQLLHILWRSTNRSDSVEQNLDALSSLADALIIASLHFAERQMEDRFGPPINTEGKAVKLVTLAMGKLGGRELNFSSDVDLVFLYTEDGETQGARALSASEYFARLTRQVIALLEEVTADGFVYRVDTRLRPFGDSGPPVVSFTAFENYLLQHGRSWERYAYVKARVIGDFASADDIDGLRQNVIEPFVYRRYLDFGVFEALRDMQVLIAAEVRKRELKDNVKLGPGGIREIEFIVQSLQLVRAGGDQQLRCRELRVALTRLAQGKGLDRSTAESLLTSYDFLRRLENGIQAIRDQQTHDLPDNDLDQARLVVVMGSASWGELKDSLNQHRTSVSEHFSAVAFRGADSDQESELTDSLLAQWNASSASSDWTEFLQQKDYAESAELNEAITRFTRTVHQLQIDATAERRVGRFISTFLKLLKDKRKPSVVANRVLDIVSKILRRSAYVALLNENPAVLMRLVSLCEQSAYLAGEIASFPLLLDELLDPRLYTAKKTHATMLRDIDERLVVIEGDSEKTIEALAQFKRATLFRIAVADVSGNLPIMQVSDCLTDLAEIVLKKALEVAAADLNRRHGVPMVKTDNGEREAGFGVIAYGKLGGMELSYRSDLDLVFLHDSSVDGQQTNGKKPLEISMYFGRLVRRLVHFLTARTISGALYEVDTRLRPSGRSGLLVINTEGFERYQEDNAWTWEHQALLRSRPVAGSAKVAREFERIRADTLQNRVNVDDLQTEVVNMRGKMRKQLDKSSPDLFDLKQGEGGIGDIEFLVQFLILKNARTAPALIHFSDNIRQLGTLEAVGVLSASDVLRLQEIYRAYRLRSHRLALNDRAALIPSDEFTVERGFVNSVWRREMDK
jgi:glutamate-ammonia-ligase adenylyltransferase